MASLQSSLVNGTLQISTAVSIDPASYANSVVVGNVGDSSWRAKGIGGSAATNHNWTIGHNGSNLYFGISNGSSASLNTWLQVAPGRTIILPAYTSNGFLKTSNSDGSITVDTATYATQSWVTSQGYLTSGSFLPLSGGTMTGDLVIKNTGTSNDIRIFTNDDDSWIDQRKPDGTVVGRLGFNGYSTSTAYYTDFQIYTRGSADSGLVSRMLIGQDRVLSLQNLTGFNYNGVAVLHASNYNSYSPTLTGGNASGTWGIRITGFANQGTARLYSTDSAYNYDAANPYFGYLTYDGTYWQFKVSPATPANVRVYTADTLEGYSRNQTGGANTIVQRDSNGYIQNSYFYSSGGGSERNSSGLGYIAGFNSSDYYVRSYNSTAVASFLGLGSMAYQNTGSYYTTSNSIYTNSGSFTTAGTGWYRVATTGSDGRGTYYVEVYTTGGNHNPSYLKILAHGDWGNDKLVTVETDGGFPASAVRITRGASNTFLEVYFTTTILGASLRVNRLGFDSSVQIYTGALPSGGDTLKDQLPVDSKFITQSISATSRIYVGNGGETLGLIGMGASNLYGLGISGAYTSLYGHFQGNGVQLGYYNGSSFTPRLIVNNGGDIVLTSGTSGTTGKLIFKTTDNSDLNKYIMQDGYWTIIGTHSNEGLRVRDSGGNILINIAGSTNGYPSRVGIGTTTPSYKLHVAGDIYADGGWLRVSGTSGLYFESYGGGFRMTGSSYVEMYGSKSLNMNGGSVDYVGSMYLESGGQGVHLQPNTSGSYGALQITSSRNGWPGIYFTVAGTSLMVNSNESGFYRQGYGWQMRWENGTGYVHKNGQGGGTSATILDTSNYTTWAQPKVYMGQSDGNWQNFTNDVGEFRVDEVLNITSGAHSNYPPNVYTYGGVLSWRLNNHSFQLYASHTGDLTFKTQWGNDNYSGWRRILHESNYNSWVPTLTGGGASGTWGISVTGNAVTAGGLAVHGGRNNEANKIVRTDSNGYIQAGWINTTSGDMPDTESINKIYCSSDDYVRYKGVADFKQQIGLTYKNSTPRSTSTTDTNYWTGMMGWGTTDFNTMITWGCGFIDSWASPGNSPGAGYTHFVGVQALHYTNGDTDGTDNYGYQLVAGSGVNSPLFLRVNWGSAGSWKTMLDSLNFNSYSPSLTGNGASGNWAINVTGNAATATILQTARNINGTSFNGSAAITTATWGTARTLTIGSTGKSVDGSAAIAWSLAEIGAAATNQTMFIGTTSVAINRASSAITLTGVSIDGNAATATTATNVTIANGSVTLAKIENITAYTILGNSNASAAATPAALSVATVATMLSGQTMNINGSSTSCSGTATNATTAGGLAVHTGTNDEANKIVRTQGNGYIMAGWINTISGDNGTTAIDRVYASSDGYIRYYTPANFRTVLDVPTRAGSGASGNWAINITGNATTATSATSATTATNVAASGITGQTGMWTSAVRPGPYRLYRNDDNSAYNVQLTWQAHRTNYWSLRGYLNDTFHAECFVVYSGYADTAGALTTTSNYQVANLGINVAASNKLHINGDNANPAIRVDNGAVVLAASVASNGRGFYGWLPISIGGTTKWIQLYNT